MQNYWRHRGGREERDSGKQLNKERTKTTTTSLKPKRISKRVK